MTRTLIHVHAKRVDRVKKRKTFRYNEKKNGGNDEENHFCLNHAIHGVFHWCSNELERHEKNGASFPTYFESNVLKVEGERITVSTNEGYTFVGREFTESDVYAKIVFSIRDTQPFEQQVQLIQIQYIDFENAILVNHGARYDRDADVSIDHSMDELIEAMEDLTAFDIFEILEEGDRHVS